MEEQALRHAVGMAGLAGPCTEISSHPKTRMCPPRLVHKSRHSRYYPNLNNSLPVRQRGANGIFGTLAQWDALQQGEERTIGKTLNVTVDQYILCDSRSKCFNSDEVRFMDFFYGCVLGVGSKILRVRSRSGTFCPV